LNLALEYVDQLNAGATLNILPSFEKVVQIEAKDFSEDLFETIRLKIQGECLPDVMPIDELMLAEMRNDTIKFANNSLSEKLGQILDCRSLIELSDEFEQRIKQYYKPIFKQNLEASRFKC
jgi:hypothetical protein